MVRNRLKFHWIINIAQTLDDLRAAWMIATAGWRIDQAGGLASRDLFICQRIFRIRLRAGSQESLRIWVLRVVEHFIDFCLFDEFPCIHNEDAL